MDNRIVPCVKVRAARLLASCSPGAELVWSMVALPREQSGRSLALLSIFCASLTL